MIPQNIPTPKVKILIALPLIWFPDEAARLKRPVRQVNEQDFRRARVEVNNALYLWRQSRNN